MSGKHGKNDKQKDVPKTPLMQISRWHLWLFRIIALTIIPALLFLLVELTLRIVGYGFPATAIIKCELDGRDVYCVNLATILFNQGKIVEAEQTIRQGKIYAPQSLDLNYYLDSKSSHLLPIIKPLQLPHSALHNVRPKQDLSPEPSTSFMIVL